MVDFYKTNKKYQLLKRALVQKKEWNLLETLIELIYEARMDVIERLEKIK